MNELPPLLDTKDWDWVRFETPSLPSKPFWLGIDKDGHKWLTKLRGGFRGHRELVFGRLAQKLGWSCQTTVFAKLDDIAIKLFGINGLEPYQAMHWFMSEHVPSPCNLSCPLNSLAGRHIESIGDLASTNILHIMDMPKSELAACLFGGNEPPGRFITTSHEFVIIDSELMFSSSPSSLSGTMWWNEQNNLITNTGLNLAYEMCREVAGLSNKDLNGFVRVPSGVMFNSLWDISKKLNESHEYARRFINKYSMS